MTVSHKGRRRKGDKAELEVLAFLRDHLDGGVVRPRLEGDADKGDIGGLRLAAIQVKSYDDIVSAIREGLAKVAEQKANSGKLVGAVFVRRRGGNYLVAMSPEDWVALYREATT